MFALNQDFSILSDDVPIFGDVIILIPSRFCFILFLHEA